MPETAMKIEPPISDQSRLDPRLRAGRGRICRHALLRGATAGVWTTLPVAALLWKMGPASGRTIFLSVGLIVLGAFLTALYHQFRVRSRWPRIWDATLGTPALVETVVHCHRQHVAQSWHESLRARSSQIPLPAPAQLHRLAPFPSPLVSLLLTLLVLWLGSWHISASEPNPALSSRQQAHSETSTTGTRESRPAQLQGNPAELLRSREDAALALAGRSHLSQVTDHLRGGSDLSAPTSPLLDRDRQALKAALGRLLDSDPRREVLEQWLATDRPVDTAPSTPIPGLQATGDLIARDRTPGIESGSADTELANGGRDVPNRLESTSEAAPGLEPVTDEIRLERGIDIESEVLAAGRSPSVRETSSSWDRVRDDPRLEPRWIEVIDLYLNLLRGREQNGGR